MHQFLHKHIDDICALLSKSAEEEGGYHAVVTRTSRWRKSLIDAAASGSLKAYDPITQMLYVHDSQSRSSPWFRLQEINAWLAEGESNVFFDENWNLNIKDPSKLQSDVSKNITKHVLTTKSAHEMDHPVRTALERTPEPKTQERVWGTLRDMADSQEGFNPLIKFVPKSDGDDAYVLYENKHGALVKYTYDNLLNKLLRMRNKKL